uniref:starch synthase n=1 Tax=uncultured Escherichia sp. TaxID=237777 RepID=A0A060CJA2_9ESCH|nr:Glyco_transf_5 [uncultured Escherichia sp.]
MSVRGNVRTVFCIGVFCANFLKGESMQVLHVCSEIFPLLKTGGLADVIGALPAAQLANGVDARVVVPAFPISAGA